MNVEKALTLESVRHVSLFQGLTAEQLTGLLPLLHPRLFAPEDALLHADRAGDEVFILRSGTVRVFHEEESGAKVVLAVLGKGELVGEMSVVDGRGRSASVVAQEETRTLAMNRDDFWRCLRTLPTMAYELARLLSRRVRIANARLQAMATMDVRQRVAWYLSAFADEYGEPVEGGVCIPFRLTQQDIADMVGATRIHVNQVLGAWKKSDWYRTDSNGRIVLIEPEKIRALLPGRG